MNENTSPASGILQSAWVVRLAVAFLIVATLFVGTKALNAIINFDTSEPPAGNVITVEGQSKVSAIPDVATVSFTVSEEAVTASAAQSGATKKSNIALAVLTEIGIDESDIKTTSYTIAPKYAYVPPCYGYCPPPNQHVTGYTVSQTIEVKIRDTAKVGDVLAKLGDAGISNLSGPSFTIDNEDKLRAEARTEAIEKAQAKAEVLADELDVRLVRVVSFWESGSPVFPYDGGKGGGGLAGMSVEAIPQILVGENDIVVNVSITYEIR